MKKKIFIAAALLCFVTVCFAAFAGLPGKWRGSVTTPDGNAIVLTYNFKIDGDKLTGSGESQDHEVKIDSGKVTGNEFTFQVTNSEGIVIPHKGKYYPAADTCGIDLDFQGTMFHTTLKRVTDK
jgi:hypothetical protein